MFTVQQNITVSLGIINRIDAHEKGEQWEKVDEEWGKTEIEGKESIKMKRGWRGEKRSSITELSLSMRCGGGSAGDRSGHGQDSHLPNTTYCTVDATSVSIQAAKQHATVWSTHTTSPALGA